MPGLPIKTKIKNAASYPENLAKILGKSVYTEQ
jgi:hypothetical protein